MFPRGLIIFIIILVFDIISKSIKDKKKIEKSRKKKQEKLNRVNRDTVMKQRPLKEVQRKKEYVSEEDVLYEKNTAEYTAETKNTKTSTFNKQKDKYDVTDSGYVYRDQITDMTISNKTVGSGNKMKKSMKNDILKGIIYSEILSEPKSLKNIKRSI